MGSKDEKKVEDVKAAELDLPKQAGAKPANHDRLLNKAEPREQIR